MRSRSSSGIVLISILVLTLVATFFLGALVQMNPSRLRRTVHDEKRDRAAMAARAGVDYALNRLKSDIDWRADGNSEVVSMADLVVREDNGNVLGWMRVDGTWTGFRFRFNRQDGYTAAQRGEDDGTPAGADDYNEPLLPFHSSAISLNNLTHAAERHVEIGDGGNFEPTGQTGITVPSGAVALLVEGIVAPNLDPSRPQTLAQAGEATVRTVEGLYVVADITEGPSVSGLTQAPKSTWSLGSGQMTVQAVGDQAAVMRNKETMELSREGGLSGGPVLFNPDQDTEVLVGEGHDFLTPLASGQTFAGGIEAADDPFIQILWEKMRDTDQNDPISLPAGVYAFSDGDVDGRSTDQALTYYEMDFSEYRRAHLEGDVAALNAAKRPVDPEFLSRVQLDGKAGPDGELRDVITFEKDVEVNLLTNPDGSPRVSEISIIPERGARQKAGYDGEVGTGEDPIDDPSGLTDGQIATAGSDIMSHILGGGGIGLTGGSYHFDLPGEHPSLLSSYHYPPGGFVEGTNPPNFLLAEILSGNGQITFTSGALTNPPPGLTPRPGGPGQNTVYDIDPAALLAGMNPPPPILLGPPSNSDPGFEGTKDPMHVPNLDDDGNPVVDADGNPVVDATVPQDIEVVFDPPDSSGSAILRSEGDIFLGTHISGQGGGVAAQGELNLIGFGVDLEASLGQGERAGVALYGQKGINVSTYDEKRNKYWDVDVYGSVYSEGEIHLNTGEPLFTSQIIKNPNWGRLEFEGVMISLGEEVSVDGNIESGGNDFFDNAVPTRAGGIFARADRINMSYEPRFLAPFLEESEINPTFAPLSVSVK